VIADIADELGQQCEASIKAQGGKALYVHCDVASADAHCEVVEVALQRFGRLDIAVNNAGIGGAASPAADYAIDEWHRVLGVNLHSAFYGIRAQVPAMVASGGGSIVNVASILGAVAFASAPAYVTAKHGMVGLTKAAALDHAQQGIRVNAVGPGFIRTPMISAIDADPAMHDLLVSLHPLGRLGEPHEVANLVCFLAGPRSSFITGAYIPVDGGYLAR
jgi:NAD(P)-dependent dehydrogenase (short-subunit alcohol dehydrogenase family)